MIAECRFYECPRTCPSLDNRCLITWAILIYGVIIRTLYKFLYCTTKEYAVFTAKFKFSYIKPLKDLSAKWWTIICSKVLNKS